MGKLVIYLTGFFPFGSGEEQAVDEVEVDAERQALRVAGAVFELGRPVRPGRRPVPDWTVSTSAGDWPELLGLHLDSLAGLG